MGGFELRKWNTNCERLQDFINNDTKEAIDENCIKKILGLDWNITSDEFIFYFTDIFITASNLPVTKRNVLKLSSMFFDPLGLISPIVLQIKILFKEACALKCTWDDVLNDKFIEKWKKFFRELQNVTPIKAGRYLFTNHYRVIDFELHGFYDASNEAYSASVYVRLCKNYIITTNLVTAESKIKPSKKLTVPSLELMSCLLISRLVMSVKKALSVEINMTKVFCWSDSKVALWWIKSVNKKWKVLVENRLSEIRENIGIDCWRYVPTECNPADIATRCNKKEKFNEVLWFKGASFLIQDENEWPKCEIIGDNSENVDEKEVTVVTNLTSIPQVVPIHSESSPQLHFIHSNSCSQGVCHFINIERFSTFGKLVRVIFWVTRFI